MKYELIHDSIAKQIFKKISYDALEWRKAENLVIDRFIIYNERRAMLTKRSLNKKSILKNVLKYFNLSEKVLDYCLAELKRLRLLRELVDEE